MSIQPYKPLYPDRYAPPPPEDYELAEITPYRHAEKPTTFRAPERQRYAINPRQQSEIRRGQFALLTIGTLSAIAGGVIYAANAIAGVPGVGIVFFSACAAAFLSGSQKRKPAQNSAPREYHNHYHITQNIYTGGQNEPGK